MAQVGTVATTVRWQTVQQRLNDYTGRAFENQLMGGYGWSKVHRLKTPVRPRPGWPLWLEFDGVVGVCGAYLQNAEMIMGLEVNEPATCKRCRKIAREDK